MAIGYYGTRALQGTGICTLRVPLPCRSRCACGMATARPARPVLRAAAAWYSAALRRVAYSYGGGNAETHVTSFCFRDSVTVL
jgi:hypothetical protein